MKKIPTLFDRDWDGDRSRVVNEVHPDCEWVLSGEGIATRKYDGTCCLVRTGKLYKRHEVRDGKPMPDAFVPEEHDLKTGKRVGWLPIGDGPEDKWHREAWGNYDYPPADGTYELVGPKVQGNPERFESHVLVEHAAAERLDAPHSFESLREWLADKDIEGIVFVHPEGRMAKIKLRDFGFKRSAAPVAGLASGLGR